MLVYGIPRLRTNNLEDFVRFAALIEVLPLVPNAVDLRHSLMRGYSIKALIY